MKSQVTTKQGDEGNTRSLGGDDVPKSHPIIECTGSVDELRAHIALLRQLLIDSKRPEYEPWTEFLFWVLHACFLIGTACNDPKRTHPEYWYDAISEKHLDYLESKQRKLEDAVQLPKQFIAAPGNALAAQADVVTTVARRLERRIVALKEATPEFDTTHLAPFVNRLSDTLYMLARFLDDGKFTALDYNVLNNSE